MSKRLQRHVLNCFCAIITGDRGAGKSTLFAFIVDTYLEAGYEVYCQYPYKGCKQIPLAEKRINGVTKYDVDKEWLYEANLSHSVVLIDEARTVWPSRSYAKWSASDDEFFNFIRKNDTHVFLATQAYDCLDLNIRRAADYTYYMTPGFWHFSHIETSHTTVAKIADRNTEVQGRMFRKGMQKVSYDICEVPSGYFLFWRKRWYNKFISTYTFYEKPFIEQPLWEDMIDFEELQEKQGYIENSVIIDLLKEFAVKVRNEYDEIQEMRKNAKIDKENESLDTFYDIVIDDDVE